MINRFFAIVAVFSALSAASSGARAQECRIEYEARVNLRKPEYGAYSLWDTVYGSPGGLEIFRDGLYGEDGQRLSVVGEAHREGVHDLLFVQIGQNGRVLLEQAHRIAGLEEVVRILPHARGFAVFANEKDETGRFVVWMGIFDRRGFLLGQTRIAEAAAGMRVTDVEPSASGDAYFMAASVSAESGGGAPSAALYRLDTAGNILSQNAFVTGGENRISGLELLDDGGVLATGFSSGPDGRKNGWIIRLDKEAGIVWQQVYPRGAGAELIAGKLTQGDLLAVAGTASSLGEKRKAGWVMTVDADNGVVGWQRFVSGEMDFYGQDLQVSADGVISVILKGVSAGPEGKDQPHVRIATFSPRGEMFSADAFYNGEASEALRFVSGAQGARVMAGSTLIPHRQAEQPGQTGEAPEKKDGAEKAEIRSYQGWVLAVPSVGPYKDPCARLRPER